MLGGGARAPLHDIIDRGALRRDQLVVLGACDAGTISQAENNEALGVPVAFLLAGASTVIGAQWPVSRPAAAALCLRTLRELRDGHASPEALQRASRWLRSQDPRGLAEALEEVRHPLAATIRRYASRLRVTAHDWGAFVHWGAAWTCRSETSGSVC